MIGAYCERHRSVVLLPLSAIETFTTLGPTGRTVQFRCHCGHVGTMTIPRRTA